MTTRLLTALALTCSLTAVKAEQLTINAAKGWLESAYATWTPSASADSYNVYYSGEGITDRLVDTQLIRSYGSYYRVDVPGLKAGSYTLKIVPVSGGAEGEATVTPAVTVLPHDRSGYAFYNNHVPGAYKTDGTLKANAQVIYITENTKNTVTFKVQVANKGKDTDYLECTGFQAILDAFKKGYETRPFAFRLIGQITDPSYTLNGDIVVDHNSRYVSCVTIEGVGDDATIDGWGIRVKGASDVEIRNLGTMNCDSDEGDNIGLQQDNEHIWVHNCDFFYGHAGSDADQVKGDGALDCKLSNYVTFSYNHFFDSGKSNLLGLSEKSTDYYITYHHNWYDHSDSRHPRVRYYSAHVYNNYYDGNAKYGVGSTLGSSVFVEANYYRNCPKPMMISMQGSDTKNGTDEKNAPTFSKEDGGIIKAFGNVMTGSYTFAPYNASSNPVHFDAYVASSRSEAVPSTVASKQGGNTYNNFDTSSSFYTYTADAAADVPTIVTTYAGRTEGGDFKWTFNNAVDDASYAVNTELKAAVTSYKTSLVSIQGDGQATGGGNNGGDNNGGDNNGGDDNNGDTPALGNGITHNFTEQGTTSSFFTISGNTSDSKGTVTYNGLTLTTCLKLESSTSIKFTLAEAAKLTLVLDAGSSKKVSVDGTNYAASNGIVTVDLEAGAHEIKKGDSANLFYIALTPANATGISSTVATASVRLYPNPVVDMLYVDTNAWVERIEVYNLNGATAASSLGNAPLSLRHLPAGVYIVRVTTDEGTVQQRIIKR